MASSRVGTTTRARGRRWLPRSSGRAARRIGTPKASVLPVPVLAWPMRSCPSRAIGSVSAWIGNAVVMPSASRAAQMGSAMPKSRKVLPGAAVVGTSTVAASRLLPLAVVSRQPRLLRLWRYLGVAAWPGVLDCAVYVLRASASISGPRPPGAGAPRPMSPADKACDLSCGAALPSRGQPPRARGEEMAARLVRAITLRHIASCSTFLVTGSGAITFLMWYLVTVYSEPSSRGPVEAKSRRAGGLPELLRFVVMTARTPPAQTGPASPPADGVLDLLGLLAYASLDGVLPALRRRGAGDLTGGQDGPGRDGRGRVRALPAAPAADRGDAGRPTERHAALRGALSTPSTPGPPRRTGWRAW